MNKKQPLTKEPTSKLLKRLKKMMQEDPAVQKGNLLPVVQKLLERKKSFLSIAAKYPTPCYVLDEEELDRSIHLFSTAFTQYVPQHRVYFAVKTNNHPFLLKKIMKQGWGLDVSSIREFDLAAKSGCKDLIYTGPGKTIEDLLYVLQKNSQIIIHMDSFGELEKLGKVTNKIKRKIKAGIRISTTAHTQWSKFGISLNELKSFWEKAKKYPYIDLQGVQFHLSWNEDATPYKKAIKEVGTYLQKYFTKDELAEITFIDFGGGFRPYNSEGIYPWMHPQGAVIKTLDEYYHKQTKFVDKYFISPSIPVESFAKEIGDAINKYLAPLLTCTYFTEPGRIICNNAMHILVKIVDKKSDQLVIVDGGINIVGWERFLYEYFPIVNLSHPSEEEKSCTFGGPLCTPDDVWGYYYYGSRLEEGDVCLIPSQGCLTYSMAQNFIQPIPHVYVLPAK